MSPLLDTILEGAGLRLDDLVLTTVTALASLVSTAAAASCPRCGIPSDRVHSHYRRTVADLPCQDRPVALRLLVRRFRCVESACPQRIFCERLPGLLDAHARTTDRLTDAHLVIGAQTGPTPGRRIGK
jgi:transposase